MNWLQPANIYYSYSYITLFVIFLLYSTVSLPLIRLSHERYINTTRCSCVNYSGFLSIKGSSSHTCSCGVSQGSVLGLLLFVLYTTPLSTLISSLSLNHHLYADDTQLFFFYPSDLESSITHLQNALQQISSWMTANLLTLNSFKTRNLGLKVNNRSFRHASPCLWNQLPKELRLPTDHEDLSLSSDLTLSVRHFLHHRCHHPLLLLTFTPDSKLIFSTNLFLHSSSTFPPTGLTPRTPAVFRFSRACRF